MGFNSGILLYGDRGTGKSGTLGMVTMWAHTNKWVVVNIPDAMRYTENKIQGFDRHHKVGLYVQ